MYNDIADNEYKLIIKPGAEGVLGSWSRDVFNGSETIELNRNENMKQARDSYPSDSAAQEKILYMKSLAETYIHEMCHSDGLDHPGGEAGGQYTTGYYATAFGRCEREAYKSVFGEEPPSVNKVFNRPGDYGWNVQCMLNIDYNSPYFDSLYSGAAASDAYPSFNIEYHPGDNPFL